MGQGLFDAVRDMERVPGMNAACKAVLRELAFSAVERTGLWRGTLSSVAAGCSLHRRTVQRKLKLLEQLGLVRLERAAGWDGLSSYRVLVKPSRSRRGVNGGAEPWA